MGENELDSIVVTLSEDKMNAFLCLRTPYGIDGADKKYNYEEVLERIKECGVKMGINEQKIHSMIDNKTYDSTEIIASGKASQDGEDGEYKFFFETKHNGKPVVKEDGSVDYYNIKLFELVTKGQKLVEYIPHTNGVFGFDVCGKLLIPKPGRPKSRLRGRGFTLNEDETEYYAAIDGKVEYKNMDLNVLSVLTIDGDVSLNVGNIDFNGDVEIKGNVITGVTINAKGNVTIGGYVEGSVIKAGKDIIFKDGINGKGIAYVEAGGNIKAKFLENLNIRCHGDIEANYILNSAVMCYGKVKVAGKQGVIHGGDVTGILGIEAANLGNDAYVSTIIRAGETKALQSEYASLIIKLKRCKEDVKILSAVLDKLDILKKAGSEKYNQKTFDEVFQSKIIKNSEISKFDENAKILFELMAKSSSAKVVANNLLYPGAKVFVSNSLYEAKEPIKGVTLIKFGDKIAVSSSD